MESKIRLTDKSAGTFGELWEKEFGQKLTNEQAREYGESLLDVMQFVLDPEKPP
ncbi:hypothetical protein KJ652_06050 [Patescibacteria group bacterium]|nr:hypothetical protein [Patescibacteria group bacterium]